MTTTSPTTSGITPNIDAARLASLAARVRAADPDALQDVTNAMTGAVLGQVPHCSPEDVAAAAQRARAVQRAWAARPVEERAAVLLRFHDLRS